MKKTLNGDNMTEIVLNELEKKIALFVAKTRYASNRSNGVNELFIC